LLTGAGQDLKLRTFKLVDQLSGRTMGVRADITPQAARIDAHLLNHQGVTRLCYCDSVLHTMPATISASREPVQIGAELYGHAGIAADLAVIRLMAGAFETIKVPVSRIDLGHVGIFRALAEAAGLPQESEEMVLSLLQAKDVPGLIEACAEVPSPYREALQRLPQLYGGVEVLDRAASRIAGPAGHRGCARRPAPSGGYCSRPAVLGRSLGSARLSLSQWCRVRCLLPGLSRRRSRWAAAMTARARPSGGRVRRPVFRWTCARWRVWRRRARAAAPFWRRKLQMM
jgi:hypothetical protein